MVSRSAPGMQGWCGARRNESEDGWEDGPSGSHEKIEPELPVPPRTTSDRSHGDTHASFASHAPIPLFELAMRFHALPACRFRITSGLLWFGNFGLESDGSGTIRFTGITNCPDW